MEEKSVLIQERDRYSILVSVCINIVQSADDALVYYIRFRYAITLCFISRMNDLTDCPAIFFILYFDVFLFSVSA